MLFELISCTQSDLQLPAQDAKVSIRPVPYLTVSYECLRYPIVSKMALEATDSYLLSHGAWRAVQLTHMSITAFD